MIIDNDVIEILLSGWEIPDDELAAADLCGFQFGYLGFCIDIEQMLSTGSIEDLCEQDHHLFLPPTILIISIFL
jgi:hypothetical protein